MESAEVVSVLENIGYAYKLHLVDGEKVLARCESFGPGYLVPRHNEPGFAQRKVQDNSDRSFGGVLNIFRTNE